jgi:hypothetical protein
MMHFWYRSTSFFIPSKKKLFGCSRSYFCTACWTSPCEPNLCYTWQREKSVFSDQGIDPLDVLFRAWCRWATRSAFIHYTCFPLLKAFYPLTDLSLMHGACSILCQHPTMDFPSAHRKRTTARCSSMVQCGTAILLPSSLSAMWLKDGVLRAASYTSSLMHMWCCASAPLCFYGAISKLPLLSDSPKYSEQLRVPK